MSKKTLSTLIALIVAINFTGIATVLFVQAGLGCDTITAFMDGMHVVLKCSLGNASKLFNLITLILALIISRHDIGWCTIIYALSVGFSIDFYGNIVNIQSNILMIRLIMIMIGQCLFVLTYSLLIKYQKGMNAIDAITYGIVRKAKLSYKICRTTFDVCLLILAWIMGGAIGIGTIFTMATTGILVDKCVKLIA